VLQVTGLSRTGIYHLMRDDRFPRPVPLAKKTVGWPAGEVAAWIAARMAGPRAGNKEAAAARAGGGSLVDNGSIESDS
jgi:prophage regulatory protein